MWLLDEADEMLNMGLKDIEFILKETINHQIIWLFSATMPTEIRQVNKRYMVSLLKLPSGRLIRQYQCDHQFYLVQHINRYEALKRIIVFHPGIYGLIFTPRQMRNIFGNNLSGRGIVTLMHCMATLHSHNVIK